ncbi:HISTONE DEACETYLASE [Salix koriyanagi]|uniref:HISTONE DEACETYLASE n=1 Tax=Salix koriyanagi TaxID=2511006 RepID=A0A9Q0UYT5_9ROSI|nr:HISTONE DEACETYLASE [Salix koriyanagi]
MEPFSKLKVEDSQDQVVTSSSSWRTELSKIDIWYACFGSNMWKPRFLCYIEGGQVDGMKKPCTGSMDKNLPKEILWKIFPHRLYFGRDSTRTWGPGGAAFLHPDSSVGEKTYMCLYKITLEQFNDSITNKGSISLEVFKSGWYHNVVYLGNERDIPILTMTWTTLRRGSHCLHRRSFFETTVKFESVYTVCYEFS